MRREDLPEPGPDARAHSQRLLQHLRAEIGATGPIPFSRFMELALYAPGLGYYSAGSRKFGAEGDFITSPELGPSFARCVADAVAPLFSQLGTDADFLELGGGSGAFAESVLPRLAELDALPRRYALLEPSADLRQRQRERLRATLPAALMQRVVWLDGPPQQPWNGLLFANEVLDALPTPRFALRDGEVFEEHVGLAPDGSLERKDLPADGMMQAAVRGLERKLGRTLPDGYRSELLVQLPWWIQAVTGPLQAGALLFVDYGYARGEYYAEARSEGTLVCSYRHRAHTDPYFLPGLQDLTAFVDFTALAEAGLAAGFELEGYCSQTSFLLGNGLQTRLEEIEAIEDEVLRYRRHQEIKRLTLPGEMGERFQVMGLSRDVDLGPAFGIGDLSHRL